MIISLVPLSMAVEQAKVDLNVLHDLGPFSFNPQEGRYHHERFRLERYPRGLRGVQTDPVLVGGLQMNLP